MRRWGIAVLAAALASCGEKSLEEKAKAAAYLTDDYDGLRERVFENDYDEIEVYVELVAYKDRSRTRKRVEEPAGFYLEP